MAQPKRNGEDGATEMGSTAEVPLGRALQHPLRVNILAACHQNEVTPKQFAKEYGIHVSNVGYHFRALEKAGYIRVVRHEQARGSRRYFYLANKTGVVSDEEFARLSATAQRGVSEATLRDFNARCKEALKAGTFDSRPDSHFTWAPRTVDEQGWKDLMDELDRVFKRSAEIEAESRARSQRSGARLISTTCALAGFESPSKGEADDNESLAVV